MHCLNIVSISSRHRGYQIWHTLAIVWRKTVYPPGYIYSCYTILVFNVGMWVNLTRYSFMPWSVSKTSVSSNASLLQERFEEHNKEFKVLAQPPHVPDLHPIEHQPNDLLPDTTLHLKRGFSEVCASTDQSGLGSKRRTKTIIGRWSLFALLAFPSIPCYCNQMSCSSHES